MTARSTTYQTLSSGHHRLWEGLYTPQTQHCSPGTVREKINYFPCKAFYIFISVSEPFASTTVLDEDFAVLESHPAQAG